MKRPWALITGASSGIGYRYAEELASRGYDLVIVSNENAALRDAAARVANGYGVEVRPLYMDLAAADAADALFAACRHEELKISVLVNNAGIRPDTPLPAFWAGDETPATRLHPEHVLHNGMARLSGDQRVRRDQTLPQTVLARPAYGALRLRCRRDGSLPGGGGYRPL